MKKLGRLYLSAFGFFLIMLPAAVAIGGVPYPIPFGIFVAAWIAGLVFICVKMFGKKHTGPKPGYVKKLLLTYYIAGGLLLIGVLSINLFLSVRLERGMRKYVRDGFAYAGPNPSMPDNPRFVFYDLKQKKFIVPKSRFRFGTSNPEKANVVVAFSTDLRDGGDWVVKQTGKKVSDATAQSVSLIIIRTSDWSIIRTENVSETLPYNSHKKQNIQNMEAVERCLNRIFLTE